jgi:hypothetical protein
LSTWPLGGLRKVLSSPLRAAGLSCIWKLFPARQLLPYDAFEALEEVFIDGALGAAANAAIRSSLPGRPRPHRALRIVYRPECKSQCIQAVNGGVQEVWGAIDACLVSSERDAGKGPYDV